MKKDVYRFFGVLIIILFFSYFVYPTPYYYTHTLDSNVIIKINRFTGSAFVLNTSEQKWSSVVK